MAQDSMQTDGAASQSLSLEQTGKGLALVRGDLVLLPDLSSELHRLRPDRLSKELLVRACRMRGGKHPTVVDATAGLGEDALLLAAAGCEVTLYESNPLIFALLADSLERATNDARLAKTVSRMHPVEGDSIVALEELVNDEDCPEIVYLDPMFPERTKHAAVKKKFQLLHYIERPCEDEARLLSIAREAAQYKVVVKRPMKGPYLAGKTPSYSLSGKAIRFDVYVT